MTFCLWRCLYCSDSFFLFPRKFLDYLEGFWIVRTVSSLWGFDKFLELGDFGESGEFGNFSKSDDSGKSGDSGEFCLFGDFSRCGDSGGSNESGDSSESGESGQSGDPCEYCDQTIYGLYGVECHNVEKRPGLVCFGWVGLVGQSGHGPEMQNFTDMADIFV